VPLIEVKLLTGRDDELVTRLMKELTATAVSVHGVPPSTVRVIATEIPRNRWATGGILKSEEPGGGA
jgi:4-oxalocrotonate tautomerase